MRRILRQEQSLGQERILSRSAAERGIRKMTEKVRAKGAADIHEDIFGMYMRDLEAIEPCTKEENEALLLRVRGGDAAARTRLIEGNLRNALLHIRDYLGRGVPAPDLIQEASIELMMLADGDFEESFEELLESRIRVRMDEVVREQEAAGNVAKEVLERINRLQEVSARMAEELGREAKPAELAERMQVPEDEIRELMKTALNALNMAEIGPSDTEDTYTNGKRRTL